MGFNLGDIVRLKSSGPRMTVSAVSAKAKLGAQTVQCEWFNQADRTYELKSASFATHTLVLVQSANGSDNETQTAGNDSESQTAGK